MKRSVFLICGFLILLTETSYSFIVTNLTATYSNGQVFLVWTCPSSTNLKYNVYRSTTKFTDTSQLNSSTYIGNVRDSSSKNIRLSMELGKQLFFRVDQNGTTLTATQGLYVFTCTDDQSWYYAVMVEKLSNNKEDKKIKSGKNCLKTAIQESISDPQPILQDSAHWNSGDHVLYYAWFVNNIDAPNFPAMCSEGSYGFNFYLIKRGTGTNFPLFAFYEGLLENSIKGNGLDSFQHVTDCYILGFDDWIPTPDGNFIGENTFWAGYHEDYDMYDPDNPIPVSGTIKMYSQKRYIQSILWSEKYLPIDTTKIFVIGISAGAMGAYLTANIIPEKITAAYCIVGNFIVITIDNNDTQPEQMWGDTLTNLPSELLHPETGDPIPIFNAFDISEMLHINRNRRMPLFFSVHGKNDVTIPWTPLTTTLIDSLQSNQIGGIFFWDQRTHEGDGKNFNDGETMPDWYSYSTQTAYPAFSNCNIDQEPGNGNPADGDPYGAINGYLDYDKGNVTDNDCKASFHLKVRNLYVGGQPDPEQYFTAFANVTLRNTKNFNPLPGQTIKWNNFNASNVKIQTGSFGYEGGLITIPGVQINKTGCRLETKIVNCNREDFSEAYAPEIEIYYEGDGCGIRIVSDMEDRISFTLFNMLGEAVFHQTMPILPGETEVPLNLSAGGIYILSIEGTGFSEGRKLFIRS